MIETFKYLQKCTDENSLRMSNEDLVKLFRGATTEFERSQAVSSLYVKNIAMLLRISNKYTHIDSSEKAGMITEELMKCIKNYDFSTKFITYLTSSVEHLFLWNYTNNRREIEAAQISVSIDDDCEEDEKAVKLQVEDEQETSRMKTREFITSINLMFKKEISMCPNTKEGERYKEKLINARNIVRLLLLDDKLTASQIARKLGWFKTDKQGNYNYIEKPNAPDYTVEKKIVNGNVVSVITSNSRVREAQWPKVNKTMKFIKELFTAYKLI